MDDRFIPVLQSIMENDESDNIRTTSALVIIKLLQVKHKTITKQALNNLIKKNSLKEYKKFID